MSLGALETGDRDVGASRAACKINLNLFVVSNVFIIQTNLEVPYEYPSE
jgi:hypothetical protein